MLTPRAAVRRTVAGLATITAALLLGACGSANTGHIAIAMDPAGRLLLVVALCDGQQLSSVTMTDETSGTATTVHPRSTPPFGGTVILTAPITDPRPEGAIDLLDRAHDYTVRATTYAGESGKESGQARSIRFTLDTVVRTKELRSGSVLAANVDEDEPAAAQISKDDFLTQARDEC